MEQAALSPLASWESYYVIIGAAAGALTGLQFVVIVLSAELHALGDEPAISAFGTPTIVHFCVSLLISAIVSAPWPTLWSAGLALAACGVGGLAYAAMVARRTRQQTGYVPVLEDWIWHVVLPLIAYAALLAAGSTLESYPLVCLFVVGATALLLLFIGIHNAWDAVVYIALARLQQPEEQRQQQRPEGRQQQRSEGRRHRR